MQIKLNTTCIARIRFTESYNQLTRKTTCGIRYKIIQNVVKYCVYASHNIHANKITVSMKSIKKTYTNTKKKQ